MCTKLWEKLLHCCIPGITALIFLVSASHVKFNIKDFYMIDICEYRQADFSCSFIYLLYFILCSSFYTLPHGSGGILWFHVGRPCVSPFVRVFSFPDNNLRKCQWIFTNFGFVCVEVLRPSQPRGVMSSAVSLPNHTFTRQA